MFLDDSSLTPSCSRLSRLNYGAWPRHPLILCASLVQNPANLGGLCRLAEVFRLESLVLSDGAIAQDPAFRRPAVSAQHWQPIAECAVESLPSWIAAQQESGYAVIALDANPHAVSLMEIEFPAKMVLLLGRELTGIPNSLLEQCDRIVTIPQYGLVESLNVQHAGAIAVYDYIRQWPQRCSQLSG